MGTKKLDLTHEPLAVLASRAKLSLESLPYDIHHLIIEYLHPVDRLCLGLTCKTLLVSTHVHPRLTRATWIRFIPTWVYSTLLSYECLMPEWYPVLPRLAHGWLDKKVWRYCWKCHRILPRVASWFREKGRMKMDKAPRWSVKVGIPKAKWLKLGKRARYTHLIDTWCMSAQEDSSVMYCDDCRHGHYQPGPDPLSTPVECPICLEKELTYTWNPQRGYGRAKQTAHEVVRWSCIFLRMTLAIGLRATTIGCLGLGRTIGLVGKCWR